MIRIQPIESAQADDKTKALYNAVQKQLGSVPNLFKTIAQSHAALTGYLQQTASLANGVLNPQLREQIALVTAGKNQCNYCASAHSLLGKMAGIDEQERTSNLHGKSGNTKTQAALDFSASIVDNRGQVSDNDLTNVRKAGYSEGEIVEIVAHTCVNIFTNYFNNIAGTEVDFPLVSTLNLAKTAY